MLIAFAAASSSTELCEHLLNIPFLCLFNYELFPLTNDIEFIYIPKIFFLLMLFNLPFNFAVSFL